MTNANKAMMAVAAGGRCSMTTAREGYRRKNASWRRWWNREPGVSSKYGEQGMRKSENSHQPKSSYTHTVFNKLGHRSHGFH